MVIAPDGSTLLAAHDGVFRLEPNDRLTRISPSHVTSLAVSGAGVLASGQGREGMPIPLQRLGAGGLELVADAPAFSLLAGAGGSRVYGAADKLQRSDDDGRSWRPVGDAPEQLIALAAWGENQLLAATGRGLRTSEDGGASWQAGSLYTTPATAAAAGAGNLHTFQRGLGLMHSGADPLRWKVSTNGFGQQIPVKLVLRDGRPAYVVTHQGKVFRAQDEPGAWRRIDRPSREASASARRGAGIYAQHCQICHGVRGVGESYELGDEEGRLALALDETQHAWHHIDENLARTIAEGTGGRMPGWGEVLSPADIKDVIVYMKHLWGERELRCQGPAHMRPDCRAR